MRVVEARYVAHLNPADAANRPDGTWNGHTVVEDPAVPQGYGQLRMEIPAELAGRDVPVAHLDEHDLRFFRNSPKT